MTDGLSTGDVLALTRDRDDDGFMNGIWGNPFIYLVWMYAMRWFNGGFGNDGNALTQAELFDGLGRQDILGNQHEIQQSLCGISSAMQTGFGNIRYDNLQNTMGLQNAMTSGFYGVNSGLAENRFAQQQCCCETNRSIDAVRADAYKNTCEITTAIHAEGEATRALINDNTMQALRDKLADRDRDLLYANFQNSQYLQNSYLVDALRPVSRPAYLTCSPYQATQNYCNGGFGVGGCTGA